MLLSALPLIKWQCLEEFRY